MKNNGIKHLHLSHLMQTAVSFFFPPVDDLHFSFLSDLGEDKISVSLSCQLPSSSSHCVVSTSEKRGTKRKSLPLLSQNLSKFLPITVFLHTPVCSFRLSYCQAPSSSGHVELLSPYQPNHIVVASVSRTLRIVWATPRVSRWLSQWETPGSSSSLVALRMCSGVCVPRFLTSRTI